MPESVYKVIELVGSSEKSWEDAASKAVTTAGKSLKDLRIAEVTNMDLKIEEGKIVAYRTKLSLSFRYHD
ncbi:MAG: dodecin domain-containing protein [bacterium]|nr:dodecin domain-containing protein [bacterium]